MERPDAFALEVFFLQGLKMAANEILLAERRMLVQEQIIRLEHLQPPLVLPAWETTCIRNNGGGRNALAEVI